MLRLGGLWKNVDKSGQVYLSGDFGQGCRIVIMPNAFKTKASQPDYTMSIVAKEERTSPEL